MMAIVIRPNFIEILKNCQLHDHTRPVGYTYLVFANNHADHPTTPQDEVDV